MARPRFENLDVEARKRILETAAEEFKIPMDRVKVTRVDTAITPFGFGASSNTQTQITGNALRWACQDVKKQICNKAAEMLEVKPEDLETRDSKVFTTSLPSPPPLTGILRTSRITPCSLMA